MTLRFDGMIVGVGTSSGVRLVVGIWPQSPFGSFVDVMLEHPDGARLLVAPSQEIADFVASTYGFDTVLVAPTSVAMTPGRCTVDAGGLHLELSVGRRTGVGRLLALVPRPLARRRAWCVAIGPFARLLRPGVRTHGSAGHGRREYYCALDECAITGVRAGWDGRDLGDLRPVDPPVRFGFGSTPRRPSLVRVTTVIIGA